MRPLKSIVVAAVLTLAWVSAAMAQFQPTPSPKAFRPTYQATFVGLVTAASATDIVTIQGSATKIVSVTEFSCTGISTTVGTADLLLIKRSTANTTGTSTTATNVPNDSASPAATAVVKGYTANPGALGTAVGTLRSGKLALQLATTGLALTPLRWQFGDSPYEQPIVLRGVAQTLALNGNAATLAAGASLDCNVTWTEN